MKLILNWARQHVALSIVIAVLTLTAGLIAWNLFGPGEDAQLEAIRRAGFPATLADLNAYYPKVSPSENAALVYGKVFGQPGFATDLTTLFPENLLTPPRGQRLSDEARTNFAAYLAGNQEIFSLLHQATNYPVCRYAVDMSQGFMVPLMHLSKQKQATTLLANQGVYYASEQDPAKAAQAIRAAQHSADALAAEPILISYLVRISCWSLVMKRMELAMNLVDFSEPELAALQAGFARAENPKSIARSLAGERAFGLALFIDPRIQNTLITQGGGTGFTAGGLGSRAAFTGMKMTGLLRRDKLFYLNAMETNISVAQLPYPERYLRSRQGLVTNPTNRFLIFSRLLLPSLGRTLDRDAEFTARMRVAQTALAVARYRLAHQGVLPESLDDLSPAYLPKPLTDMDGTPLHYQKRPAGFIVYSTGLDGVDDGGMEGDPKKPHTARDITFIVEQGKPGTE